jgi:hypothetical protein
MKKLPVYIFSMTTILMVSLASISLPNEYELTVPYHQTTVDTTILPYDLVGDRVMLAIKPSYTLCSSKECFLANFPDVLPGEPILPGVAYSACSSEECFLAIISDIQYSTGMPLLILADKSH